MKKRSLISALLVSIILISFVANASAITGRMGNSRMVLNLEPGEEIRRHILVQNVNDVPLVIELLPTGDLADSVSLEENEFTLEPGEEKRAYFTIRADKTGTTETKINVMFKPPQGSGVGLSATIIVVAGEGSDEEEDNQDTETEDFPDASPDTTPDNNNQNSEGETNFSPIMVLTISSAVLVAAFIILLAYSGKKLNRKKKRSGRPRE